MKKKLPLILLVLVVVAVWLFIPSHSTDTASTVTEDVLALADNAADMADFQEEESDEPESMAETANAAEAAPETVEEPTETAAQSSADSTEAETVTETVSEPAEEQKEYVFRNSKLLNQHYEKHGIDMGFASAEEYQAAASAVVNNPEALHKTEKEDGDDVYYVEATNEFVIVSGDGYLRTYFNPSAGLDYFNRQ